MAWSQGGEPADATGSAEPRQDSAGPPESTEPGARPIPQQRTAPELRPGAGAGRWQALRAPVAWLALIAAVYAALSLAVIGPDLPLSRDESTYASQISRHAPPAPMTEPRARGLTYLIAPITWWTPAPEPLRIYLGLLGGLALFGSYAVWLKVRDSMAVPLAALLFAGFWGTMYYAPAAMPNLWFAYGAVTACGLTVLIARHPRRRWLLAGLALVLAGLGLIRPSDATFLAAAIGLALLWWLRRHGLGVMARAAAVVTAGLAVGWAQWFVEGHLRYGGALVRLRDAAEHNHGELGWYAGAQLRVVHGSPPCTDCTTATVLSVLNAGLWLGLAALAAIAAYVGLREHRSGVVAFLVASACATAVTYVFLIPLDQTRFMLPAYALLAIPAAAALLALPARCPPRWRPLLAGALALGVVGYLTVEQLNLQRNTAGPRRQVFAANAERLAELGVRPPCFLFGTHAVETAYVLGCHAHAAWPPVGQTPPRYVAEAAGRMPVAVLAEGRPDRSVYVWDWTAERVPGHPSRWLFLPPPDLGTG